MKILKGNAAHVECKNYSNIRANGTITKLLKKYMERSRNYRKQPYWALNTYCEKYECKNTKY